MIKKIIDFIYVAALTLFYFFGGIFLLLYMTVKEIFNRDK
tara:strand:+ start:244 stop:363 length:120 start_codon:yes stop_codon:yes gene_type:complete